MRRIKILVDAAMYGLFLYLMSYHAGQGLFRHGVLGCILLALFFLHHGLNWKWYRSLPKGRFTLAKISFLSVDLLLLIAMALMAVSSVQLSGDVFAFSPFFGTRTARSLHTVSTAWGFALTALHMGLHTRAWFAKIGRRAEKWLPLFLRRTLFFLLLAIGCATFWHSGLWKSLFLLSRGGRSLEGLRFYADYLLLTFAACQWVYLLMKPKHTP
ncbi:MAG: DUF4405 domain-containing protein [Clostridia bacterium]|nr:DUF4405 domain-containing protein [Clostridia bacterium]